jgi:uncharacterized membrane protein
MPIASAYVEQPLVLLLLPLCLGVVYPLWRTSRVYLPPVRRVLVLVLRLSMVSLVLLALANPMIRMNASDLAVAILLDRSDSISPSAQSDEEQWLAQALASKQPHDQVAVVSFGGIAQVESERTTDATPPRLAPAANEQPSATNIAGAIQTGLAALPADAARRIVLLSDGVQNQGDAQEAAGLLAASGVQLQSVPIDQQVGPEALVDALEAPTRIHQGDKLNVTATIRSTVAQSARLDLLVDDQLAVAQSEDLQAGSNRFVLPVDDLQAGGHVLQLQLEPDQDTLPQNNVGGAFVMVDGPPRVLIVEGNQGDARYLADALTAAGLSVDVRSAQSAPLDASTLTSYATVVLANVPADLMTSDELQALQAYVQTGGGGLVVSGGDQAFGPGGYARTPLENMLPVQMDLRGQSQSASTAMILIMDVSGSMGEAVGGTTKIDLAEQAAISAAQSLGPNDVIGVLAFDDKNHWIVQPTSAGDLNDVDAAISEMQPGGGTEIYPAVAEAESTLAPINAKIKHLVLLTDGQAPDGPYDQLAQQMQQDNITLSTISIGTDADRNLLQRLAQLGNGRFYDGTDPFDLPQLLVKETQEVQRAAIVEHNFQPQAAQSSPILTGIDPSQLPPLRGYVATTPKPQSTVVLSSDQHDPVLAEWQYGLGRVVAWTSDVSDRWSANWVSWPAFASTWAQLVKFTARSPEDPDRQLSVDIQGNQAQITLDSQTGTDVSNRAYLNFLPTVASVVDPGGQSHTVPLPQVAPGRYQASLPIEQDGVYMLNVAQTNADSSVATESSGFVRAYSPEYAVEGTNRTFLDDIARLTGGRTIESPDQAFMHDLPSSGAARSIAQYLLALAALLLLVDVGVRRVRLNVFRLPRGAAMAVPDGILQSRRPGRVGVAPLARLVSQPAAAPRSPASRSEAHFGSPMGERSKRLLEARQRARR